MERRRPHSASLTRTCPGHSRGQGPEFQDTGDRGAGYRGTGWQGWARPLSALPWADGSALSPCQVLHVNPPRMQHASPAPALTMMATQSVPPPPYQDSPQVSATTPHPRLSPSLHP